jgi:hypothetical protein
LTTVVVSFFLFNLIKAWRYKTEPERPDFVSFSDKRASVFAVVLEPTANAEAKEKDDCTDVTGLEGDRESGLSV